MEPSVTTDCGDFQFSNTGHFYEIAGVFQFNLRLLDLS